MAFVPRTMQQLTTSAIHSYAGGDSPASTNLSVPDVRKKDMEDSSAAKHRITPNPDPISQAHPAFLLSQPQFSRR